MSLKVGGIVIIDDNRNISSDTVTVNSWYVSAENASVTSGDTASRPLSPSIGTLHFDTDIGQLVVWNGTEWV